MADHQTFEVTVGPQGRLVVPAPLRRQLGIRAGDVLVARAQDDRLVLERRDVILARARSRYAVVPRTLSLADELIRHRREESEHELRA